MDLAEVFLRPSRVAGARTSVLDASIVVIITIAVLPARGGVRRSRRGGMHRGPHATAHLAAENANMCGQRVRMQDWFR